MSSVPPPPAQSEIPPPASRPPEPAPQRSDRGPDEPPWPPWTAPAAVGAGFVVGIVLTIILEIAASAAGSSISHPTAAVNLIASALFDAGFVAVAIYFASLYGRPPKPVSFGFRAVGGAAAIGGVLAAGVTYYVVTALYASALHLHGNEKLPKELGVGTSTAALVGATIFVCVVAPMAEEFFFRGFIFGALRQMRIVVGGRNLGVWVAAVLTGILFGAAHIGSAPAKYLVPLAFLGFVLCVLRWRTRSLYPCMALHSINNSLALGISQLHWTAGGVLALIVGSLCVIVGLTAPLAARPIAA